MDKVLVINLTAVTQHVGVLHPDGKTQDAVQIMPKRRVHLRVGMTVDPAWIGRNIGVVRIQNPQPDVKSVVPVPTPLLPSSDPVAALEQEQGAA